MKIIKNIQNSHENIFRQILNNERDTLKQFSKISNRMKQYDSNIKLLTDTFNRIVSIETKIRDELNKNLKLVKTDGVNADIKLARLNSYYEDDINVLTKHKQDIIKLIINLKNAKYDTYLQMDAVLFENNVLLNKVTNNMKKMSKYV